MSDDKFSIEIDGRRLDAPKGAMIIQVADAAGIHIPRFCYHKKLSIAANCRMCLVEVERAPKALPACATPVTDGMKVSTRSRSAVAAQKATMEFLLINHPLDCPICDQGGECELQDVSLDYGGSVSRFTERKRAVQDKDIGPLIETEMTRCIHCTRCVRFADEIAGLRELGATGRGENMEIGTFVQRELTSELSGNVIDLCPVGALTAKPSRFRARAWELVQRPSVSVHDALGSNVNVHTLRSRVVRVVPRENEAINECWISDRDRFSYVGLASPDRALEPLVRGERRRLRATEWESAVKAAADGLRGIVDTYGADEVGVLASPTASVEELYLLQKIARGLGIANVDHRLRQTDFRGQRDAPPFPWLGQSLKDLERVEAALLIGSDVRMEAPLLGHRIRNAALAGGSISSLNPRDFDFRFPVAHKLISRPSRMPVELAAVARAVADASDTELPKTFFGLTSSAMPEGVHRAMADTLLGSDRATILLGNFALRHPAFSQLRLLAGWIARSTGATLGFVPEGGNAAGAWLSGALPHRLPGAIPAQTEGLNAAEMLCRPRKAYVLFGVEPELDCGDGAQALDAVKSADWVLSLSPFAGFRTREYSDVLLPMAGFAETGGTWVNLEGRWQSVQGAVGPPGEARPGWKILRVLGNSLELDGFDQLSVGDVANEVYEQCRAVEPDNQVRLGLHLSPPDDVEGLERCSPVPIYSCDALVRRSGPLQASPITGRAEARIHPGTAARIGVHDGSIVDVRSDHRSARTVVVVDASIPEGSVWIPSALEGTFALGPAVGEIEMVSADEVVE